MFVVVFYFGTYISWANIHFFSFSLLFSFLYFASIVPSFCDPPYFYFSFSYLQLDYFFLFLSLTSHSLLLLTVSTPFSCLHFPPPSLTSTSHSLLLPLKMFAIQLRSSSFIRYTVSRYEMNINANTDEHHRKNITFNEH